MLMYRGWQLHEGWVYYPSDHVTHPGDPWGTVEALVATSAGDEDFPRGMDAHTARRLVELYEECVLEEW